MKLTIAESQALVRCGLTEQALDRIVTARQSLKTATTVVASCIEKPVQKLTPVRDSMVLDWRVGWDVQLVQASVKTWKAPEAYRSKAEASFAALVATWGAEAVAYEAITLRWGQLRYTPDFVVIRDGKLELLEVKGGYQWAKDRVRIKAAGAAFPMFPLSIWALKGGVWREEIINGR
jgi:hypothetical protein